MAQTKTAVVDGEYEIPVTHVEDKEDGTWLYGEGFTRGPVRSERVTVE